MQTGKVVLSAAYLPPVRYMCRILNADTVFIESSENYQKQSYRNRCYICGANGIQPLIIPVLKGNSGLPVKDVKIDNGSRWKKNHIRAIESAYRLSPYFEYYADNILGLYSSVPDYLLEWDMMLLNAVSGILGVDKVIGFTEIYRDYSNDSQIADLRNSIHPKDRLNKPDPQFRPVAYHQVFNDRYGFAADMSIIDLIFNEGPYALQVLKDSSVL